MARRARDYKAEYQRRQDQARRAGFTSYGYQRRYQERERAHPNPNRHIPVKREGAAEAAAAHYQAFYGPEGLKTKHPGSRLTEPVRHWYVDVLGSISPEEWEDWIDSELAATVPT